MNRTLLFIFFSLLLIETLYSQVEERLRALDESQVNKYVEPLSTAVGLAFNSGTYVTADIPSGFHFSAGGNASLIFVPDKNTTFVPDLPEGYDNTRTTATIFGNEGGYYAGPQGYIVYPPGINEKVIPALLPQIGASYSGTGLLLRYLPPLDVGETSVSMFGVGVSHSISQYFPLLPIDLAVQGLYSSLTVKDIADQNNLAFNIHASKEFGFFTLYSGLQYEQSTMDLTYTFRIKDPQDPNQFIERDISASLDAKNNFRFTLGGSLKMFIFRLHGDLSAGTMLAFNTGVSIEI